MDIDERAAPEAISSSGGGSPGTDEVRIVSVPITSEDEIPTGTMRFIADQCGAEDFHAWCRWIDENCYTGRQRP